MAAKKTFPGGVHPIPFKKLTKDKKISIAPLPEKVIVPLLQSTGNPAKSLVNKGDAVSKAQAIGEAEGFISSRVHSPISGKVTAITKAVNPVYGMTDCVFIESDGTDKDIDSIEKLRENLSREDIIGIIKGAGIVGLGGAAFPTHVKLLATDKHKIDSLIINGAECEPYLTCDYRVMLEKSTEILRGVELLDKAISPKKIYIAIECNKPDAILSIRKAIKETLKQNTKEKIEVVSLETKYPQGGEKQLIKSILKREVPPKKLPFEVGCSVHNVGSAYAVYEAVYKGKPLIERCITLTGSPLKGPGNFLVKIGTPLSEIVEKCCGGFQEEPAKIILGGPMMGIAHYTLNIPIIKGMSGVLFLSRKEAEVTEESSCIKCGKCVDVCPVNLVPTHIARTVKKDNVNDLEELNLIDCMECGACGFICPARIPLVQYIKLGKMKLGKLSKK